jgi:hypothetical protein
LSPLITKEAAYDALAARLAEHAVGDESPQEALERLLLERRTARSKATALRQQVDGLRQELLDASTAAPVYEEKARVWREAYVSLKAEVEGLAARPTLTVLEGGAEGALSHG